MRSLRGIRAALFRANQTMTNMNQLTTNLIRLERAEAFLSYRWPLGLRPNLETEIKLLRRQLPAQTIAIYNQLKQRGTPAVAEVVGGVCQGCHQPVTPNFLEEIKTHKETACCPNCGRFLYIDHSDAERGRPVGVSLKNHSRSRW